MSHIVLSQPKNQQFQPNHRSPRTNTEQTTRLGTLDKKIRRGGGGGGGGGDDFTIGALTYHLALSNLYMVMPSVFEL